MDNVKSDPEIVDIFWWDLWEAFRIRIVRDYCQEYNDFLNGKFSGKFSKELRDLIELDTILINNSSRGNIKIVKVCVELGADIHVNDDDAFRWAFENGHLEVMKYLIDKGADVHAIDCDPDIFRFFWLDLSAVQMERVVSEFAEIYGDFLNGRFGGMFNSQLRSVIRLDHIFVRGCEEGCLSVVKACINLGVNVNLDRSSGFRLACGAGHLEVVKYLVENGADIHTGNDYVFRLAVEKGHTEIVEYLKSLS